MGVMVGLLTIFDMCKYLEKDEQIIFENKFEGLIDLEKGIKSKLDRRYLLDKYYVDHISFALDLKLIYYTLVLMFKKMFSKKD
jgi:lipopolysaccharide/colanic/teichoic acid biosynthesis glycosyltransferase